MTMTSQPPQPEGSAAQPTPAVEAAGAALAPRRGKYRSGESVPAGQKVLVYSLLALGSLAFLIPFYFVANGSLKSEAEVQAGEYVVPVFLPKDHGKPLKLDALVPAVRETAEKVAGSAANVTAIFQPSVDRVLVHAKVNDDPRAILIDDAGGLISNVPLVEGARWSNYPKALSKEKMNFRDALSNTVVITTLCVAGQILSCSLVGFGFARFSFRGKSILFMVMLSTMMLPAQVTMIPVFVLFRYLNMIDSFWPLILPAWFASPFFVFMFRQFFSQIPEELVEAARIDGASNWRIYWQLMLPLSGPVIAIVAIYTFLGTWNDFLGPLIYLNAPENRTLALALNSFKGQYGTSDAQLLLAASVVCMLPCVVLFFAMQKYFVESVSMSGLKS